MVKYIIYFGRRSKITLGDLLSEIDRDGTRFFVPKYCEELNKWALLVHESECEKVDAVLCGKGVQYTKVTL